jgi:hypothetical protein
MSMTKKLYWLFTLLFAALMGITAIPDVLMQKEAVVFIKALGYPEYFIFFIGVAKVLGSIAILVPGLRRLKEWAYAGLVFDLIAAIYSIVKTQPLDASITFLLLPLLLFALSYTYYHKLLKEGGSEI